MLPNQLDPSEHLLSWCQLFGLLFVAGSQTTYTTTDTLSLRTRFNMPVGYVVFASWRMAVELSTALLHAFHHALVPLVMWLLFEFACGMPLMGLASREYEAYEGSTRRTRRARGGRGEYESTRRTRSARGGRGDALCVTSSCVNIATRRNSTARATAPGRLHYPRWIR